MTIEINTLPQNNLPDEAVPWGRDLQGLALQTAHSANNLEDSLIMSNRATAGQMGALGRQIEELVRGRSTHVISIEDVAISRSTAGISETSRSVTLPDPFESSRSALITLSGAVTRTSPAGGLGSAGTFLKVSKEGVDYLKDSMGSVGGGIGAPSGFASIAFTRSLTDVVNVGGPPLDLSFYISTNEASAMTFTFSNLRLVVQYQDKV